MRSAANLRRRHAKVRIPPGKGNLEVILEKRNVIWVASYPKSGNTWVHGVLRTAGKAQGFPQGPMDVYDMISSGLRPDVCPAVRAEFASHPASVLKTHAVMTESKGVPLHKFEDLELKTAGFIYVYRNPLDLLLSYINFTRLEYGLNREVTGYAKSLFRDILGMQSLMSCEEWSEMTIDQVPRKSLDHALGLFSERGLTLPTCFPNTPWSRHVRQWVDASSKVPAVVMKYEDCLADKATFNQMARFFTFGSCEIQMGVKSAESRANHALEEGTYEQRIFYNKMQAYYYPRYFSEAAVDSFVEKNRDVLQEFGYQTIVAAASSRS